MCSTWGQQQVFFCKGKLGGEGDDGGSELRLGIVFGGGGGGEEC